MTAAAGRLVRDGLPAKIKATGREPRIRVADDTEYRDQLRAELAAAARDAAAARTGQDLVDKLTDVLELIYTIAGTIGCTPETLAAIRRAKQKERGGFSARIIWLGNQPLTPDPPEPTAQAPQPRCTDDDAPLIASPAQAYGLCQNCLKNQATRCPGGVPVCDTCLASYDFGSTTGSPT